MNRPEELIQRSVISHLKSRSMPGAFWFHCPMGGYRRKTDAAVLKAMGARAGVPDLICVHRGAVHALEIKSLRGRVTPVQKAALDALQVAGARVAVAYTLDEALITLEHWGILRRDRSVSRRVSEASERAES